jgi:hypothetical protein
MATVVFRDESATGHELDRWELPDVPDVITVRELVRLRVREEVARHNAGTTQLFRGLVRPADADPHPDGYRLRRHRKLDWEQQASIAEEAFARNGFIVLFGDRQVEDLDQVVDLTSANEVSFVKLVPLVGG